MARPKLTTDEVLHIAALCNLTLSTEEIEKLSTMLAQAIEYIEILNELDTSSVNETYQVTGLTNVFQEKTATPTTLSKADALKNASHEVNGQFSTPAIFNRQ